MDAPFRPERFRCAGGVRGLRKTEFGYTVYKNASRKVKSFEYRYLVTETRKVSRAGKTRRSGTDYCSLVTVRLGLLDIGCAVFVVPVGNKTLQSADTHGIALYTAYTLALALCLDRKSVV